jgi:hypothetical protein
LLVSKGGAQGETNKENIAYGHGEGFGSAQSLDQEIGNGGKGQSTLEMYQTPI